MRTAGVSIDLPADFSIDQTMISFRAPPPTSGDPRVLHKQTAIRPSLIVHRRSVGDTALELAAGEVMAELVSSVAGLSGLATESMTFRDGSPGVVVSFDFGSAEVGTARQYHALRKDGPLLTSLTLTVDKLQLGDAAKAKWLTLLASAIPDGEGALQ